MFRFVSLIIFTSCLLNASAQDKPMPLPAVPTPPTPGAAATTTTAKPYPLPAAADAAVKVDSYLVSNADEFAVMYERLIAKGYPRAVGHATAVARMVNCLFKNKADEKADFLDQIIQNLSYGTDSNFRRLTLAAEVRSLGDIKNSPRAATLASILACKMGDRKFEKMMADLDAAVLETNTKMDKATGGKVMIRTMFNLITVAELMN